MLQRDLREPSSFFSVAGISSVVARQVAEVEAVLVYPPEAAARLEPPAADLVAGRDLDDCMFFFFIFYYHLTGESGESEKRQTVSQKREKGELKQRRNNR